MSKGYIMLNYVREEFCKVYFQFLNLKKKISGGMIGLRYIPKVPTSSPFHKKCFILSVGTSCRSYLHINLVNTSNNNEGYNSKNITTPEIPEPPTNCCFSGCANCVWIKYAEDLSVLFTDAEDKVKSIILNKIDDPNMKAFLITELRSIKFKK